MLYQAWAFVAPGLYTHEKKLVLPLVVSSTILFFAGVAFCYFFVFGKVFTFIQSFAPKSVSAMPDIEAYLSFVLTMFIAFGAAFEVPIAVVVLARLDIVSIEKLKSFRSYFIVARVHHRGDPDAARHRLAARARDPDVPALRGRHLGGADLHPPHAGAGRGEGGAVALNAGGRRAHALSARRHRP